jgi:UDP:flavonoid glycosyltransferase YjiC (YdhE family)
MRLLIPVFSPPTGTWGSLTRVLAVAEAARAAGHQVAFCAAGFVENTLRRHGYQVYSIPPTTMFGLPKPLSRLIERRSQFIRPPVKPGQSVGSIWLVLLATGVANHRHVRRVVKAVIRAIEDFHADKLFTELDPGAYLAAAVTGVPLASTYAHIATHGSGTLPWRLARRTIVRVLRHYGRPPLTPDQLCFNPSVLKIIPSIPELDDTDPARPDVRYVGRLIQPVHAPPPDKDVSVDTRRCVFVYTGTGSLSLKAVQAVLPHVFPADEPLRCLVGGQSIPASFRREAVEFHPYVPSEQVLPQCDWTICHGGQNTIAQSLSHGVPLIVFPGAIFERRYNAEKVEQAGAGLMGEVNEFNVRWLRAAMKQQSACAAQAARLAERIRSYGGAAAAVTAIAQWP